MCCHGNISEVNSEISNKLRETASQNLKLSSFATRLDALKNSIEGLVITPNDESEYMKARTRPFNEDIRG